MINIKKYIKGLLPLVVLLPVLHMECFGSHEDLVMGNSGGEESRIQDITYGVGRVNIGLPITPINKHYKVEDGSYAPLKKKRYLKSIRSENLKNISKKLCLNPEQGGDDSSSEDDQQNGNNNSLLNNNQQGND